MNLHKPLNANASSRPHLLCASFNQDQECLAIGHEHGFQVFNTDPMERRVKREFADGGIGIVQMLHRTNYLALVGGGRTPKYPQNKVIIWDDLKNIAALSLEFLSPVLQVLLSRTRIVVCLRNKVYVYIFSSPPVRLSVYETIDNPTGICAMQNNRLVFPGITEGHIQIVDLSPQGHDRNLISIVRAHKGKIKCLAVSHDGSLIASASDTGTIIRIYSSANTTLLHEFRRGIDRAVIHCLSFSPSSNRLALLSDKDTLHIFDTSPLSGSSNRRHILSKVPLLPRYFSGEWSFVSSRISDDRIGRGILGWASDDAIVIIWTVEGLLEKYIIQERKDGQRKSPATLAGGATNGGNGNAKIGGIGDQSIEQWELVRESWRSFDDV
ncbi:WD40-repeat-containing domain protein [Kockiozyma suomiensis]|uniref:WD40-repeat-containing domain protein n=1 Tax=Kockiozyma suomiensis TaxID=1337062 RepID=UPI0033434085